MELDEDDANSLSAALYLKGRKTLGKVAKFWRTQRAVLRGDPLFDWSSSDLKSAGYLGAWPFCATKIFYVGGLAWLFAALSRVGGAPRIYPAAWRGYVDAFEVIYRAMAALPFPAALTAAFAVVVAWGSVRRDRSTKDSRDRARRAYLYFDTAYGVWPHGTLAITLFGVPNIFLSAGWQTSLRWWVELVVRIIFLAGTIWQMNVSYRIVPLLLFKANGYSRRVRRTGQEALPDDPPWHQYVFAYFVASLPLTLGVIGALLLVSDLLTRAYLWLQLQFVAS
jgi:hypothetical protein